MAQTGHGTQSQVRVVFRSAPPSLPTPASDAPRRTRLGPPIGRVRVDHLGEDARPATLRRSDRYTPVMACDPDDPPPYTLWFETLPSDDTARLLIGPGAGAVQVVLFWNGELHTERTFATIEAAEDWGIGSTKPWSGMLWPVPFSDTTMTSWRG